MRIASRVENLPPYIFADLERMEEQKRREGVDIISLGIGDPDIRPPSFVIYALVRALDEERSHQYSSSQGERHFREAVAKWYDVRFGVKLDPDREICALIGSKEGLANFARAFVDPGERVGVPDPGYPVYAQGAALLSDGRPVRLEMNENFLPKLPFHRGLKVVYLNYPNNPTAAFASLDDVNGFVDSAHAEGSILCYDNAYSEQYFGDNPPPSVLQTKHSREGIIEFHSLSKTFNMTGFRIGFAAGDAHLISGLKKVKSQIDSGIPKFIQAAGSAALAKYTGRERPQELVRNAEEFERRMKRLVGGLDGAGFDARMPSGTFYLWLRVKGNGADMVRAMIDSGIVATPGIAFGLRGDNYVRFAVTQPVEKVEEAVKRMSASPAVMKFAGS